MTFSFKSAVRSALLGHLVGLAVLVLLSCIAMMLSYPSNAIILVGVLAFSLGAAFVGFENRAREALWLQALVSGLLYAGLSLVIALFGKGETFSLSTRLLLFLVAVLLSVLPGLVFHKKKKRRRAKRR